MPSDFIKVIEQRVKEARPDLDIREFTALHDVFIKLHAVVQEPLQKDIDTLSDAQSLASPAITDEDIDRLGANLFLFRRTGANATGLARVFVTVPATLVFVTTSVFVASNGSTFAPTAPISFPESLVRLNVDGPLYFVDIPVTAVEPGEKARIKAHTLTSIQGSAINFAKIDNPFPFSGGVDRETNAQFVQRIAQSITVRDLVSGLGIQTRLKEVFSFLERVFVAGFLDPEMSRDLVDGFHVGGKGDVRIKLASLLADQVKITVPASDGSFILSDGLGAPGDDVRPPVFMDSVRLLGPGPAFVPVGTPRTREETTLVAIRPLVTTGEYQGVAAAINITLNQLLVTAIEVISPTERYVVLGRLDIQGNTQTAFTRVSAASEAAAHPHVAVNPSNNRAYVVWVDGGTVRYKILDTASTGFPVVKDTTDLIVGTNETLRRIDSAFSSDGHIHIVLTQRSVTADGTSQDAVWYARLTADGVVPGLNTPKQAVFDLPGDNGEASVVVHGTGINLVVTIGFSSKRGTYSNIYATQLDNDGASLGLPVALTAGFEFNDQPYIRPGPGDAIHLTFRRNFKGVSYLRFQKAGLPISVPRNDTIVRSGDIDELRMTVNPYGYPYVYWSEFAGDFDDIFSAKLDPKGVRVGPVHNLADTPYFSSFPTLLSDSSGALHLLWIDGIKGFDKPFYLKRLPQEWRLIVKDARFRYSVKEELAVAIELPAANGVAVDIRWADLLPQVQSFVSSNEARTIVADLLVRYQIPAIVSCNVVFGPRGGSLSESAAKAAIEAYINDLQGTDLQVSGIIAMLHAKGAASVSPFEVTVKVDEDSGDIRIFKSNDVVKLPRGVFLTAVGVTAKWKV